MGIDLKLNSAGVRELLLSDEIQRDLDARAERVRAAAQGALEGLGDAEAQVNPTPNRGRAEVFSPLWAESAFRILGTALDAARD